MTSPVIGIFDSGAGGLVVMKALIEKLPHVSIVYFGDTARLPYGDKSPAIINHYACTSAAFLAAQAVNMLVVACNTASAYATEMLRKELTLPVIDVIAPSVAMACRQSKNGKIAVLGTYATINSGCYQKLITFLYPGAEVTAIACPLFVPLIEESMTDHPATALIVAEYLRPLRSAGVDTVILGCTHYPLLNAVIAAEIGEGVTIIDSASCCAEQTFQSLTDISSTQIAETPSYRFFVSDNVERFRKLATAFLPALPSELDVRLALHD
jgi:glutamate racemase